MDYRRPPITEAVIELRPAEEVDRKTVEAAAKALKSQYFYEDAEQVTNVEINPQTSQATSIAKWLGIKLSSIDRTELQLFRVNSFVCSSLAPYPGWDLFRDRAKQAWQIWKKVGGPTEISRIGVRYINRIDVPLSESGSIHVEKYLTVGPTFPEGISASMSSFAAQIVLPLGVDDCVLTLNTTSVPSPLVGFASFVLDIDIGREVELPRRDEAIWELLESIRVHKNRVFELCITDHSRALFNQ